MEDKEQYKKILSGIVQKLMLILGPAIALEVAGKVAGLKVSQDGSVEDISADPVLVLKSLIHDYVYLAGPIVKESLSPIIGKEK